MHKGYTMPDDVHFHEEETYDSKRENWSAVFGVLLIPLFILTVGWALVGTFKLPNKNVDYTNTQANPLQIGIGGGAATPVISPTISLPVNNLHYTK